MDNSLLIAVLTGSGVTGVLVAVIAGMFSRRKLGAEATEIITKAASGVVADIRAELTRKTLAMESMRKEHKTELDRIISDHKDELAEVRRVLRLHVAWDAIAIAEMAKLGVNLPPAPPLLPEQRD